MRGEVETCSELLVIKVTSFDYRDKLTRLIGTKLGVTIQIDLLDLNDFNLLYLVPT